MTFLLFEKKVASQWISLWYFYVCMYYSDNWFISSDFLHSTLVLFLWQFQHFLYSLLYRLYVNHIQILSLLLIPYPSGVWPSLSVMSVSYYCCIWIRSVFHIWENMCLLPSDPG
jgi:hypothetical protein